MALFFLTHVQLIIRSCCTRFSEMINDSKLESDCRPCKNKQKTGSKKHLSFVPGILLALIPKCPFCFMAFSSTMFLCGEDGIHVAHRTFASPETLNVTLFFCALTILCIILNYRDSRTKYAIALGVSGSLLILLSVTSIGGLPLYYFGLLLIFSGVWLNASLLYFIKKIRSSFNKTSAVEFTNTN